MDNSIDSGNFSVTGYLLLIQKDSSTHTHGHTVYAKEGLPFARNLSLKNSADSYLYFQLALFHSVSYFLFLYQSLSPSLSTVCDSISFNIDEVLSINPANVFTFGGFNLQHKDWFSPISNDLTQMVNFPSQIPHRDSQSPALLDLLLSSDASTCSTVAFPPLDNSDHVVLVSTDFPQQDAHSFHRIAFDYSRADWDGLCDHFRDVP